MIFLPLDLWATAKTQLCGTYFFENKQKTGAAEPADSFCMRTAFFVLVEKLKIALLMEMAHWWAFALTMRVQGYNRAEGQVPR